MKTQDKEILLKDLCARLPYRVKVCDDLGRIYELSIGNTYLIDLFYENGDYVEPPIKPYLRPMSSMTVEEIVEFYDACTGKDSNGDFHIDGSVPLTYVQEKIDWLNAHHFDFRNLIPMGLALEAPDGMYNL